VTARHCPHCGQEISPAAVVCPHCSHPLDPEGRPGKRRSPALWLIAIAGCGLLVLMVGGIVAAIFIPNFLDALQKAKQKRTMVDLRDWSLVLEDYRLEHDGEVPAAGSVEELAEALDPANAGTLTTTDAWQHPYRYACWSTAAEGDRCDTYRLVSAGYNGVFENDDPALYEPASFGPQEYEADIVLQDGEFLRYPGPSS